MCFTIPLLTLCRLTAENGHLQAQYSALEERFRPYMEQIDGLEDLNRLLQQQTSLAQMEVCTHRTTLLLTMHVQLRLEGAMELKFASFCSS